MPDGHKFLFTITPGHTGTTWLAQLLGQNLPDSHFYHEILGWDRFGVDTPDVSHMTLFNSQGNVDKVRAFWRQKAARILAGAPTWYGETSHLLAKCGLMENIQLFAQAGPVYILCLERELTALVRSMRRRGDMLNKGDQWLWHLDPDYPRKLVAREFFNPHGYDGLRLWYGCEMQARAAYYRQLLGGQDNIHFIETSLESLAGDEGVRQLLRQLDAAAGEGEISVPPRANVSGGGCQAREAEPIAEVIRQMVFKPEEIAARYIARGDRLGAVAK